MTLPVLNLKQLMPNPHGTIDRLFAVTGDVVSGPVQAIDAGAFAGLFSAPAALRAPGAGAALKLFHFNDMHNHLTGTGPDGRPVHRFARMVSQVKQARARAAQNEIVLFISGGDDHTGTLFDELLGWHVDEFIADASYRAYSAGGVDMTVIGNHEVDRGTGLLALGIERDARLPVLSANVHSSARLHAGKHYHPAIIALCKGLRIGVLGLTTHVETRVGLPDDPAMAVASPLAAVRNLLPALEPLCDVIIILSHCGYGDGSHASGKAAVARDIGEADFSIARTARALTAKPMVLIGAHTHTILNEQAIEPDNMATGVLITQAQSNGRFLGEINMQLAAPEAAGGRWTLTGQTACLHPVTDEAAEGTYDYCSKLEQDVIEPLVKALEPLRNRQISQVATTGLERGETIAARYCRETMMANFITDTMVERSKTFAGGPADFALLTATSLLSGIDPGPLTFGNWFKVMPYADLIFMLTLTGAEIAAMLHNNAARIVRSDECGSIDITGFVARGFLHTSSGITYTLKENSSPSGACAEDIRLHGRPLAEVRDHKFHILVTSYLGLGSFGERWNGKPLAGGIPGDLPGFDLRGFPRLRTGLSWRGEMVAHIEQLGEISAATGARLDGRLKICHNTGQ